MTIGKYRRQELINGEYVRVATNEEDGKIGFTINKKCKDTREELLAKDTTLKAIVDLFDNNDNKTAIIEGTTPARIVSLRANLRVLGYDTESAKLRELVAIRIKTRSA